MHALGIYMYTTGRPAQLTERASDVYIILSFRGCSANGAKKSRPGVDTGVRFVPPPPLSLPLQHVFMVILF